MEQYGGQPPLCCRPRVRTQLCLRSRDPQILLCPLWHMQTSSAVQRALQAAHGMSSASYDADACLKVEHILKAKVLLTCFQFAAVDGLIRTSIYNNNSYNHSEAA